MYLVTNSQMKAIEQKAITAGIPSLLLMENAAMSLTDIIIKDGFKNVLFFCGKGNNGGDGFACARQLFAHGIDVKIIFAGTESRAAEDCKTNIKAAKALNIDIIKLDEIEQLADLNEYTKDCDLIVDALVGTGLSSRLREPLATLVRLINGIDKPVYSVDCPSGVSTDSGEDYSLAVYADKTVTFHAPKVGLALYPACEHTGELCVGNISISTDGKTNINILTHNEAKVLMPARPKKSDKSTYGKVFAFVGCDNITGAAYLACKSAYRIGAGLVYAHTTAHCANILQTKLPEAVVTSLIGTDGYLDAAAADTDISRASSVLIGCGLGCNSTTHVFFKTILGKINSPLVLDADGLNLLENDEDLKSALPKNTVITPHPKEMSRLTGQSVEEILKRPIEIALEFSKKYNVIVVLKNFRTVIASPDGKITINTTGTPAMSKGGSGDCLAGIISGLIAQGVDSRTAACLGCYISGKAGELAEKELSTYGVLASDIIDKIPLVFK